MKYLYNYSFNERNIFFKVAISFLHFLIKFNVNIFQNLLNLVLSFLLIFLYFYADGNLSDFENRPRPMFLDFEEMYLQVPLFTVPELYDNPAQPAFEYFPGPTERTFPSERIRLNLFDLGGAHFIAREFLYLVLK